MNVSRKLLQRIRQTAMIAVCALASSATSIAQPPAVPSSDVKRIATGLTGFSIPFKIDNPDPSYIEVQLYISRDKGKSWSFFGSQSLSASGFDFKSDGDGEYWFALKTLDRNRQLFPPGNVVRPELQVVVDTAKPILDFRVEADAAGRVIAAWKVVDPNIDPNSLKLSHRAAVASAGDNSWTPVPFQASNPSIAADAWSDQIAWWPQSFSRQLEVKIEIADSAGNLATEIRPITVREVALQRRDSNSTTTQRNPFYPNSSNALFANRKTDTASQDLTCRNGVCFPPQPAAKPVSYPAPQDGNSQAKRTPERQFPWQGRTGRTFRVGSPSELVDPPSPEPTINAGRNNGASPGPPTGGNFNPNGPDIEWESKTNRWTQRDQTHNASTLADNSYPVVPPDSAEIRQRFQDVPVVNRQQNPGPLSGKNQVDANSPARQQGDMFISESTAIGQGKPQLTNHSLQADHSIAAGPIQSQRTADQQVETSGFDFNPALPPQQQSNPGAPDQIRTAPQPFSPASHPLGNAESNYISNSPIPLLNVNTSRFNLNYDIRSIDPSGVGRVILWATEDAGRTWSSWASDPDSISPFPVEVQSEGTFGFKVVINSRDGLTGKAPVSGDPPDVWVQVDLTVPQAAITSAPYGSGPDAGKLIINFSANDQFLTLRPIKLDYSPSPTGPWTTIETALRNTGSFAWKVPGQVPEQIYLRLEARDTADNVGVHQLTTPIDISGLVPRGRIYSVDPIR